MTLDEGAETAYNNAEPFVRDFGCLLSARQWEIFQETRDAKAATRLPPKRTPVMTPATVRLLAVFYLGRSDVFSDVFRCVPSPSLAACELSWLILCRKPWPSVCRIRLIPCTWRVALLAWKSLVWVRAWFQQGGTHPQLRERLGRSPLRWACADISVCGMMCLHMSCVS